MKSFLTFFTILTMCLSSMKAQDAKPFEGDIVVTTFANYCDYINKQGLLPGGNGIHRVRYTFKGDKGKSVDETTGIVTVWDVNAKDYRTYIEDLKKGLSYEKNFDAIMVLAPRNTRIYEKFDQNLISNTVKETGATEEMDGILCKEIKGTMVREQGGMNSKYGIKAYYDPAIPVPASVYVALYGLETPGLPMKWSHSYDGGHVAMVGELSYFMESTVESVEPREVKDEEFAVPSTIKFSKTSNAMSMMKYLKDANKYAQNKIAEDAKKGNQSGISSFTTSDEWDY